MLSEDELDNMGGNPPTRPAVSGAWLIGSSHPDDARLPSVEVRILLAKPTIREHTPF
jgi:hypothetical protein